MTQPTDPTDTAQPSAHNYEERYNSDYANEIIGEYIRRRIDDVLKEIFSCVSNVEERNAIRKAILHKANELDPAGDYDPITAQKPPSILIVDDNHDLLFYLATELRDQRWEVLIAENASQARLTFYQRQPNLVLLDYMLANDDGLQLGLEFQKHAPLTHVIIMTGAAFSDELQTICKEQNFPILYKPFLAQDVFNIVKWHFSQAIGPVA